MEGWPSGLRRTPGKRVGVKAPRGFESPFLRHSSFQKVTLKPFNPTFSEIFCIKVLDHPIVVRQKLYIIVLLD